MIQLTAAACQEINRLRQRQHQPDAICRLDLQPSSCAQWSYVLTLTQAVADDDAVYEFGANESEGCEFEGREFEGREFEGVRLVVNRDRLTYIRNLKIDFSENLTGGAFRFDNPLATESCRCGYAFAIAQ